MTGKNSDSFLIREFTARDNAAVTAVLCAAFPTDAEAILVQNLLADGDNVLALVADGPAGIAGFALWSAMRAPMGATGLAPVAVSPAYQHSGIGSKLIRTGLAQLAAAGDSLVFVLGNPAYYSRFGFSAQLAAPFASPYRGPHFMAIALGSPPPPTPGAEATYAAAFDRLA